MGYLIPTAKEIELAEKAIFPGGGRFNEDQKEFLALMESCSVQAYAGTGKTTAIVGKLHILSQRKVWEDGRGVCILSHTNVAIDEVKKNVALYYPEVIAYPNFVGTIQEFVNKFLFLPYLASKAKLRMNFQDEQYTYSHYWEEFNRLPERIRNAINRVQRRYAGPHAENVFNKLYNKDNGPAFGESSKVIALEDFNKGIQNPSKLISSEELEVINSYFSKVIGDRQKRGSFLFIESYVKAMEYLDRYPVVASLLSERFQYTCLDEAQDCSDIQLKLLSRLFAAPAKTVFQQIGDTNQSITENSWTPAGKVLALKNSMRFSEKQASFINKFRVTVEPDGVHGTNRNTDRVLITYSKGEEKSVLRTFAKIITDKNLKDDKGFFAIAAEHDELSRFFPAYSTSVARNKTKKSSKFEFDYEYIEMLSRDIVSMHGSRVVSNALHSIFLKHDPMRRSRSEFRKQLISMGTLTTFNELIVNVTNEILSAGNTINLTVIAETLNSLLPMEATPVAFRGLDAKATPETTPPSHTNIYTDESSLTTISLGTIHSVKGQTHSATLCFTKPLEGGGNEIDYVLNKKGLKRKRLSKLLYVASSRPVYLFAMAIEKTALLKPDIKVLFKDFAVEPAV